MATTYEPKNKDILNKCLAILSTSIRVIKDSHATGYLSNRKQLDDKQEAKLLKAQVDDESYYNELSKDFE